MRKLEHAESLEQSLGAIYIALGAAIGDNVVLRANDILTDVVNTGAINDPGARRILTSLVRSCSPVRYDA
jgi:hypothetical protein